MKGGVHLCNLLLYEIHHCFEILSQLLSPVGQSLSFVQQKEDDQDVDKGLSFEDMTSGAMGHVQHLRTLEPVSWATCTSKPTASAARTADRRASCTSLQNLLWE